MAGRVARAASLGARRPQQALRQPALVARLPQERVLQQRRRARAAVGVLAHAQRDKLRGLRAQQRCLSRAGGAASTEQAWCRQSSDESPVPQADPSVQGGHHASSHQQTLNAIAAGSYLQSKPDHICWIAAWTCIQDQAIVAQATAQVVHALPQGAPDRSTCAGCSLCMPPAWAARRAPCAARCSSASGARLGPCCVRPGKLLAGRQQDTHSTCTR